MREDFLKYVCNEYDHGVKLDNILKNKMNLSRRIIIHLKKSNNIYLNEKKVFVNEIVKRGDIVKVNIKKEESQNIEPQYMPLDIIYEDNDLIIVNKEAGIVVHPTKSHMNGTLSNALMYYFKQKNEDTIVRLVNRLDMDTSGLVMIAKNQFSHQALAKQLANDTIEKTYFAVVHGVFDKEEAIIDLPIERPTLDSIKREVLEEGARSITHYKTVEKYNNASLLEIILKTGRTHQIRVHMSYFNHPIFGDALYGTLDDSSLIKRQALHAYKLKFNQPRTNESITVCADLPCDILELINRLKDY